ncbi:MAG TPA: hypothetical protein VGN12_12615 [Pirellulales bacterium]|jgi:hypothetical protein
MNLLRPDALGRLAGYRRVALVIGAMAMVIAVVGGLSDPAQFFRAYLVGWLFFFGLAMGSLALLMIYHLTGGAWGFLIRKTLERAVGTMPLVAVGFVPLALGAHYLYPFAQADVVASNELVRFQQRYLSVPLFAVRAAGFFVLWLLLAWCLRGWSRAEDRTGDARYARRCENLSGPGLVAFGITMHFAAIDWVMSLQPAFHSTIFGPLAVSGQILSAQAFAIFMLAALSRQPAITEKISAKALTDLGNLLLAFLIVWAYLCWFQYMLIWIANLPVDVIWYVPRLGRGWQAATLLMVCFSFAIPFLLLLWRIVKQDLRRMSLLAAWILVTQLVFDDYLVTPPFAASGFGQRWMELVVPIGIGGLWSAWLLVGIETWSPLPLHDANESSAARLRASDEHEAAWEELFSHG